MNKLEQAAQALLAHWDTPAWKYLKPTGDLMADLREALKVTEASISDHKLAEQAEQEPVAYLSPNGKALRPNEVTAGEISSGQFLAVYAAPVRIKDLTEYELDELRFQNLNYLDYARAVIAADREKNK